VEGDSFVCDTCFQSRPAAPPGFEHVGEWRPPKDDDEPFLSDCGRIVLRAKQFTCIGHKVGPHWILRKVEEQPTSLKEELGSFRADLVTLSQRMGILEDYADRLEALEQAPDSKGE